MGSQSRRSHTYYDRSLIVLTYRMGKWQNQILGQDRAIARNYLVLKHKTYFVVADVKSEPTGAWMELELRISCMTTILQATCSASSWCHKVSRRGLGGRHSSDSSLLIPNDALVAVHLPIVQSSLTCRLEINAVDGYLKSYLPVTILF